METCKQQSEMASASFLRSQYVVILAADKFKCYGRYVGVETFFWVNR